MNYTQYRKDVYNTALKLVEVGLIRLSSGNISMRLPDGNVAITPSSIPYDEMDYKEIVILDIDGNIVDGDHKPSVEKMLHINAYKAREDIKAVIHSHSIYSMALSLVKLEIPLINSELVPLGAPIPVVSYILPGTDLLAEKVAEPFRNRPLLKAVLLENHGTVVVGKNLKDAFQNAYNLETGAEVYHKALQTGKKIRVLSQSEFEEVYNRYYKAKQ
ncbi:MAG: class II aldolase/adducin family protein [Pelolinea sp.]|nr:class II aldolase/adducin family protein [Pelolinea sp.]